MSEFKAGERVILRNDNTLTPVYFISHNPVSPNNLIETWTVTRSSFIAGEYADGKITADNGCETVMEEPLKFEELESDEVYIDWCKERMGEVSRLIYEFYKTLGIEPTVVCHIEDGVVDLYGFTLDPVAIKIQMLGKIKEVPGWQLTSYVSHAATRNHPEELEDIPISEHRSSLDAACALIKLAMVQYVDGFQECKSEEGLAEAAAEGWSEPLGKI